MDTIRFAIVVGLAGIAAFQLALVLGAPFGRAAWSGVHSGRLPARLRAASLVSLLIWVAATILVASAVFGAVLGWVLCGLLVIATLMNAASRSPWERYFWAPYALTLAVLCALLALS